MANRYLEKIAESVGLGVAGAIAGALPPVGMALGAVHGAKDKHHPILKGVGYGIAGSIPIVGAAIGAHTGYHYNDKKKKD
jgi:hypothetical protein